MYIVHDYKCFKCGAYKYDHFVHRDHVHSVLCKCGDHMRILPSAPRVDWDSLARGNNASPEAIRHFERKRRQQAQLESKRMKEHGDRGKAPGA